MSPDFQDLPSKRFQIDKVKGRFTLPVIPGSPYISFPSEKRKKFTKSIQLFLVYTGKIFFTTIKVSQILFSMFQTLKEKSKPIMVQFH